MTMVRRGIIVGLGSLIFTLILIFTSTQTHAASKKGQVSTLMMPRDAGIETFNPSLSPDGRWVAYEHRQPNNHGGQQTLRLFDSENRTFIQFPPSTPSSNCGGVNPVVSNNGRYVAFQSCRLFLADLPEDPPPAPCSGCSWLFLFD